MTREELIELAALDSFGLLDEYEAALFTRSFHHAPAAVQDEIKALQANFAGDESLLPDVSPGPELRQRVLETVAASVEAESGRLAPLATIGRTPSRPVEKVGRLAFLSAATFWRAASFALAASVIVLAIFAIEHSGQNRILARGLMDVITDEQVREIIGADYNEFIDDPANCEPIWLDPVRDGDRALRAVVYVNHESGEAFLVAHHLPTRDDYQLRITNANGDDIVTPTEFSPRRPIFGINLGKLATTQIASLTFEITAVSDGRTVLQRA